MMNMNLLAVLTPPYIYHDCSTRKTFWGGKFTGEEHLFSAVNMKNCGLRNLRKHKEIKGSKKYVTMNISLKFDIPDKMKVTYSESKGKLERSGKGLITSLGFKAKIRLQKCKKARYAIVNVSKKDFSNIIREFEKFEKLPYEKKRPTHEPTDSYSYLARHIVKCMKISDTLNWNDYGGYTKMTDPSSNVNSTDKDKSKRIIVHKSLSQNNFFTDESESKGIIVHKTLSQSCSTDEEKS